METDAAWLFVKVLIVVLSSCCEDVKQVEDVLCLYMQRVAFSGTKAGNKDVFRCVLITYINRQTTDSNSSHEPPNEPRLLVYT